MQTRLNRIGQGWQYGTLEFVLPDGSTWQIGNDPPVVAVRVNDPAMHRRLVRHPRLGFGEAYMDGQWDQINSNLPEILEVCIRNMDGLNAGGSGAKWWQAVRAYFSDFHTRERALANVHHHYDLDYSLYSRFLDQDLHYSCAYFKNQSDTLETAQQAKCAHIAAKLDLPPNAKVLDIGCGWGSMALFLAEHYGARCTGITLSNEQLKVARSRAHERGLDAYVEFRLLDYRDIEGEFDAIVSVGMFEHVGRPHFDLFFQRLRDLLTPDGIALIHTIGRYSASGGVDPWMRKYIFPGGYIPSASEILISVEKSGLISCDLEFWRSHYALTLDHWNERFQTARAEVAARMGDRFCRMWEFYLQACSACFRYGDLAVFQLQITRTLDRLPVTRNYIYQSNATAPSAHKPPPKTLKQVASNENRTSPI